MIFEPEHDFDVGQVVYFISAARICKAKIKGVVFDLIEGRVYYAFTMDGLRRSFDNLWLGGEAHAGIRYEDEVFEDYASARDFLKEDRPDIACTAVEPVCQFTLDEMVFVHMLYGLAKLQAQVVRFEGGKVQYCFDIEYLDPQWHEEADLGRNYADMGMPTVVPRVEEPVPVQEEIAC